MKADFRVFADLLSYRKWVNEGFRNLSYLNTYQSERFDKYSVESQMTRNPNFYGTSSFEELQKGVTTFKDPSLIERLLSQVTDKLSAVTTDKIKAKKLKYNPNGMGMFSFDRAAIGMYRLKEFYSPIHSKVVDQSEVNTIKTNHYLKSDNSLVEKRWEQQKDGRAKIRTATKNVFAYLPPAEKQSKAVELLIYCGGEALVKDDALLYSGISAIVVAQLLEAAKIKTRINVVIGSFDKEKDRSFGSLIAVKNYDEKLDANLLALLSSDARFFRYEGFKGIVCSYDSFKAKCPPSLGSPISSSNLQKIIESSPDLLETLSPNRYYFGGTFSGEAALQSINLTIDQIAKQLGQ